MKGNIWKKGFLVFLAFLLFVSPLSLQAADETNDTFSVDFVQEYVVPGDTLEVKVEGIDSYDLTWTFDGKVQNDLNNQTSYVVKEGDLQKLVKVTAVASNGDSITIQKLISKLPVLYIDIANGEEITTKEPYRDAVIKIQSNDVYKDMGTQYSGKTEIKGRGNSTWGQPKKPYRLKFDKKSNVFGMGKSKHWVLLANYLDASLMRNTIAYNLSGEMGLVNTATVHVDVVINGSKRGNYQLCEHIRVDEDRIPVFDWEGFGEDVAAEIADAEGLDDDTLGDMEEYLVENMEYITAGSFTLNGRTYNLEDYGIEVPEITGGYAIEIDEYFDEVSKFKSSLGQPIMFKGPEFVGTNSDMMKYIQGYINAFEDAIQNTSDYTTTYDGEVVHYSDLYDMDALINYWLVQELFFNEDAMKKSSYCHKEIGEKMMMGPIWDMDWAAAGEGNTSSTNQWQTHFFKANAQGQQWYKFLIQDPYYNALAYIRYHEVRHMFEEIIKEGGTIDYFKDYLAESGADNTKLWPRGSFASEAEDFHQWMKKHVEWMDQQFESVETLNQSLAGITTGGIDVTMTHSDGTSLGEKDHYDGEVAHGKDINVQVRSNNDIVMFVNGKEVATLLNGQTYTFKQDDIITMKDDANVVTFATKVYGYTDFSESVTKVLTNEDVYVESIKVSGDFKTEYILGDEEFDKTGMVVTAEMSDNSNVDVTANAVVSGFSATDLGKVTMTVSYEGKEASFDIQVIEPQIKQFKVEGIVHYELTNSFDANKVTVKVIYINDLERDITSEVVFEDVTFTQTGENQVPFTYKGVTDYCTVIVYNHAELANLIEVAETEAEKTDFYQAASLASLEASIEEAMNVYTNGTWEDIDNKIIDLREIIENLKVNIGDINNLTAEISDYKTITLNWDKATNAESYNVYRKSYNSTEYKLIANVTDTNFASNVMSGKEYGYKVSAVYGNQEGALTDPVFATALLEGKPSLTIKKISDTKFTLKWTAVEGATRYIIYRQRNSEGWKKVLTLGGKVFTYTTSSMVKGTYGFKVKAARYDSKDRIMTPNSNEVNGTSVFAKPSLTLTAGTKQIKVSWKAVEGVNYYEVYRATSKSGKYTKLKTTSATSYTAKSLTAKKTYYFKVRGYRTYNNSKVYTSYSTIKSATAK